MKLHFRTKENITPNGKRHIFVHACIEDSRLRDTVFDKLLSSEQALRCCLWHTDEPASVFDDSENVQIAEMSVFIPVITDAYFRLLEKGASSANPATFFENLQLRGTAVLPLLESAELLPRFNRLFGELHGVALSLPDADRMLEEQLRRLLSEDELEERITKEAFAGKLFLSYRKKDIKEARQIMQAIHDTDAAGAASIWFDEFLVAGRNFNDDIYDNLVDCDAMALAVTPNLLEEGNYVRETEYREAVRNHIDVLPIEAIRTDDAELAVAFPGIGPRTNLHDSDALENLLRKAGFQGPGSKSAFAEYLLGMAFFIPVGVEKDVDRAIRLFEMSAQHGCAEACEQLGKLHIRGIGVKRDEDEGIRYYLKANEILMDQSVTAENLRHINRLYYEFDGLPLLLKEHGRVREANEIQQAFFDRICNSAYKYDDEFTLCRVNALTDLANLFYQYDLDSGREKQTADSSEQRTTVDILFPDNAGTGPSEGELNRAKQHAEAALYTLDRYHGDDTELAEFLRVVIYDQFADISKYKGDLEEAIEWKEKSRELIEPLASRTGTLEHMDRSFQISNNLGLFYRELMLQNHSPEGKRQAIYHLDTAIDKARQLERLSPDFKGRVVHALCNRALVEDDPAKQRDYVVDAYDSLLSLFKDIDVPADEAWTLRHIGGDFSASVYNIKTFSKGKDRQAVYEKYYGEVPASVKREELRAAIFGTLRLLILVVALVGGVLQFTGIVNIEGILVSLLGPRGGLYTGLVLAGLYGLTLFLG